MLIIFFQVRTTYTITYTIPTVYGFMLALQFQLFDFKNVVNMKKKIQN